MDWNRIVATRLISFHHPTNNNNNTNHLCLVDRWFCRHHDKEALTRNELRPLEWPLLWHCQVPCAGRSKKTLLDLCTSFYGCFVIGGALWLFNWGMHWYGRNLCYYQFLLISISFLPFSPSSSITVGPLMMMTVDDRRLDNLECDCWWFCHEKWYSVNTVNTLYS